MNVELLCHRLLGALVNGGYQGVLLTAIVWLGLKGMSHSNAATRHAIWFVTLLVVAALPIAHFALSGVDAGAVPPATDLTDRVRVTDSAEAAKPSIVHASGPKQDAVNSVREELDSTSWDPSEDVTVVSTERGDAAAHTRADLFERPIASSVADSTSDHLLGVQESVPVNASDSGENGTSGLLRLPQGWSVALPNRVGVALVGLWAVLALVRLGGLFLQLAQLHVLKRRATSAPEAVRALFTALSAEVRLRRTAGVTLCSEPIAPMVVGFWRPAVLLPAKLIENADEVQLQQVLRHELAHVVRRDDWANLTQQTIKAVLFFHPAVWWLSRRLTLEREIACDDHVLTATRTPREYALLLTEFAARMRCRDFTAAPAAWNHRNELTERIAMILDSKRNSSPRPAVASVGILTTAMAIAAGLALFAAPRLALAKETPISSGDAESAPRAKPNPSPEPSFVTVPEVPAPAAAPAPLAVPRVSVHVPPVPPRGPDIFIEGSPLSADQVPSAGRRGPKEPTDRSVERRLERLERLMAEFVGKDKDKEKDKIKEKDKDKGRRSDAMSDFKYNFDFDKELIAKIARDAGQAGLSESEISRIRDQAKRDAERASRDVEKAMREAHHAHVDSYHGALLNEQQAKFGSAKHALEMERKQLEAQRRQLEKQLEALERQLDRIESAREKFEERAESERSEHENHSERHDSRKSENSRDDDSAPRKKAVK